MMKKLVSVLSFVLAAGGIAHAQQSQETVLRPPQAITNEVRSPWAVSVVHTIDLHKMMARLREQQKDRVGIMGTAPATVYNIATGLVVDNTHIVTRLANLDPLDQDQKITITTGDGMVLPARLVGVDYPTGFAVLEVESLKTNPPSFAPSTAVTNGMSVKILSVDAAPVTGEARVVISPSLKLAYGQVGTASVYSKARGALSLNSNSLLSRNDGSIVTNFDNEVIGIAQYAGFGRAYLFPIEFIKGTVAKRVLERKGSVPAGWLGAKGDSLALLGAKELVELQTTRKSGVVIREVTPSGPAASAGLQTGDIIIGLDDFAVSTTTDLGALISSSPAGRKVTLQLLRKGEPAKLEVALGERPYTAPSISLVDPQQQPAEEMNQRDQIQRRLDELSSQYRNYFRNPRSPGRDEALRELEIEIRRLHDTLRAMGPETGTYAGNNEEVQVNAAFAGGFVGRDLKGQMAQHFGAKGVWVTSVNQKSAASIAGIKVGDVILSANGMRTLTCSQLKTALATRKGRVVLRVLRERKPYIVSLEGPLN